MHIQHYTIQLCQRLYSCANYQRRLTKITYIYCVCCVGGPAGETPGAAADGENRWLQHEDLHRAAHVRCAAIVCLLLQQPFSHFNSFGGLDGVPDRNQSAHTLVCLMHLLLLANVIFQPLGGTAGHLK